MTSDVAKSKWEDIISSLDEHLQVLTGPGAIGGEEQGETSEVLQAVPTADLEKDLSSVRQVFLALDGEIQIRLLRSPSGSFWRGMFHPA